MSKQINVTVMIPGIKSFHNLLDEAHRFSEEFSRRKNLDKNLIRPETDIFDDDDDYYYYNRVDYTQHAFNIEHILQEHYHIYPWSYVLVKPALDVALEKIQNINNFLSGYRINLCYYDAGNEYGRTSDRYCKTKSFCLRKSTVADVLLW